MSKLPRLGEAEFTRQVIELAQALGWRVAHFRAARTAKGWRTPCQGDAKGFPDLLLLRGTRQVVAELKVGSRPPTPEQSAWLADFDAAGVDAYVWTPGGWERIEQILR